MKGAIGLAFIAGGLLGATGVWLLGVAESSPATPVAPPPAQTEAPRPAMRDALPATPAPSDPTPAVLGTSVAVLKEQISSLEAELASARAEARRNLVRGALVLEVGGRTPEEILAPIRDIEPERGTVRFGSNPEQITSMAWMYLHKVVAEDFDEALKRCLDRDLQWTKNCDFQPEEVQMIRDYTERAYRLMVALQQRGATIRKRLADPGALAPDELDRLRKVSNSLPDDHEVYKRSWAPSFVLPKLFPKEAEKK